MSVYNLANNVHFKQLCIQGNNSVGHLLNVEEMSPWHILRSALHEIGIYNS